MFSEDLKAINAATQTATAQPRPVNPLFISISELLERVQTAPAKHLPLIDAAKLLTLWGKAQADKPEWRCNSKTRGIVRVDATQATWATDGLEYVASRGHFESDGGNGASTDYELFGFDRKEFSDFLALKAGTSIDLFCPMPDTTPATDTATPAPVVDIGTSVGVEPDKAEPPPVEQGLLTKDIAACFGDCYYSADNWPKRLSGTAWLKTACIGKGEIGGASAVWNPLRKV